MNEDPAAIVKVTLSTPPHVQLKRAEIAVKWNPVIPLFTADPTFSSPQFAARAREFFPEQTSPKGILSCSQWHNNVSSPIVIFGAGQPPVLFVPEALQAAGASFPPQHLSHLGASFPMPLLRRDVSAGRCLETSFKDL